ncbi:MAG: pseudouridine synthase [Prevotellaceae bacterium]|jgi:23S rRNA pseudouridine2605 synthase|nr:pseudouridine synthase [Prevotellaceae bacterium]
MGKEKAPSKGRTDKKTAGSNVWEIKKTPEKSENGKREQKTRKSYSYKPKEYSPDRERTESPDRARKYSPDRKRVESPDRARKYSSDKPRKYSPDRERAESPDRARKYSPNKERNYSHDSTFRTRTKPDTVKKRPRIEKKDGLVRLNKFIANSGICSRREADEYIVAGLVTVNGNTVTELGTKVRHDDDIRFNKERLRGESKVYLLLNKPKNYVTTTDDPHAKKTVMELVDGMCKERVYPVGRLDKNSTGVLLFTNDGELAKQLTHPSYNKLKVYKVKLDKNITGADVRALLEGVDLEDGPAVVDDVHIVDGKSEVGIEIHSGKNRIIRRIFEKLGYGVLKLDRVYFAGLTKKGLKRGQCRLLTSKEIEILKMGSYE